MQVFPNLLVTILVFSIYMQAGRQHCYSPIIDSRVTATQMFYLTDQSSSKIVSTLHCTEEFGMCCVFAQISM